MEGTVCGGFVHVAYIAIVAFPLALCFSLYLAGLCQTSPEFCDNLRQLHLKQDLSLVLCPGLGLLGQMNG